MKAVILAGGGGTRLLPITIRRPKPMVPIAGKPCIDYVIESLIKGGFDELVITTSYLSDVLIKGVSSRGYEATILYSFESEPLGTAGAVRKVSPFLDETFVVASGDVLADVSIRSLYKKHRTNGALATMALVQVPDPSEYGAVRVDEENRVLEIQEKPPPGKAVSNMINAGIYVLEPEVLPSISEVSDFARDVFPPLVERGEVYGVPIEGLWMDIGRPSDLIEANASVVERRGSSVEGMNGPVIVEEGAIVKGKVIGPSYIGRDVRIGQGAVLKRAYLGDGVVIGDQCVIENSLAMGDTEIGPGAKIRDSVIGEHCKIADEAVAQDCVIGDGVAIGVHARLEGAKILPRD